MPRVLGIDTSNYTTSVCVVEDGKISYDGRKLLMVKAGERGLRQSEALFQHVVNLPDLMEAPETQGIEGVCVSTRPRPVPGSYMPVFLAGESTARSIASTLGVPLFKTSHQEGHLEAARNSIGFKENDFYALHMSGGTSELLRVGLKEDYEIEIIGGAKDISLGQFLDRIGVAMGFQFPAGKYIDERALASIDRGLRIPSKVDGLYFNLSGQETMGLKHLKDGHNHDEIALAAMICVAKTLEKLFVNLFKQKELPLLITGGVASSIYLKNYFKGKFGGAIYFSRGEYASDNAVGTALIGYKKLKGE